MVTGNTEAMTPVVAALVAINQPASADVGASHYSSEQIGKV